MPVSHVRQLSVPSPRRTLRSTGLDRRRPGPANGRGRERGVRSQSRMPSQPCTPCAAWALVADWCTKHRLSRLAVSAGQAVRTEDVLTTKLFKFVRAIPNPTMPPWPFAGARPRCPKDEWFPRDGTVRRDQAMHCANCRREFFSRMAGIVGIKRADPTIDVPALTPRDVCAVHLRQRRLLTVPVGCVLGIVDREFHMCGDEAFEIRLWGNQSVRRSESAEHRGGDRRARRGPRP